MEIIIKKTKVEEERGTIYSSSLGSFQVIPQPIFDIIFSYLAEDAPSVLAIRLTCKLFNKMVVPYHLQKVHLKNLDAYFRSIRNQVTAPPAQLYLYNKKDEHSCDDPTNMAIVFPNYIKFNMEFISTLPIRYLELDFYDIKFALSLCDILDHRAIVFYKNEFSKKKISLHGNTLILAVLSDFKARVLKVIQKGCDINRVNKFGETALLYACKKNNFEIAKLLLENGADPNISSKDGNSPIYIVAKKGNIELLNLLFKYDAKISKCPPVNGQEIYYWVVYCVIFTNEVIEILLKNGLDPNRLLDRGETALEGSCSLMTHEVMVLFLKHGADPNLINEETKKTVLYKPSKAGNAALVGILLKYGADPNKACEDQDKMTPLYIASQRGHYDVVKVLLEKGADPNKVIAGDFTPLDVAVSQLRHEVINLLIKYGARRSKPVNVIIDNVPISPTGLTDSEEDVAEEEESSSD